MRRKQPIGDSQFAVALGDPFAPFIFQLREETGREHLIAQDECVLSVTRFEKCAWRYCGEQKKFTR